MWEVSLVSATINTGWQNSAKHGSARYVSTFLSTRPVLVDNFAPESIKVCIFMGRHGRVDIQVSVDLQLCQPPGCFPAIIVGTRLGYVYPLELSHPVQLS